MPTSAAAAVPAAVPAAMATAAALGRLGRRVAGRQLPVHEGGVAWKAGGNSLQWAQVQVQLRRLSAAAGSSSSTSTSTISTTIRATASGPHMPVPAATQPPPPATAASPVPSSPRKPRGRARKAFSASSMMTNGASDADFMLPIHHTYIRGINIRNFALIEEQMVQFLPGLNVVTGESGAGKSVLLGAVSQLLGAPLIDDCVRPPATSALIEGEVLVAGHQIRAIKSVLANYESALPTASLSQDGCRLYLRREIVLDDQPSTSNGMTSSGYVRAKTICRVNGVIVPLRVLRALGSALVDINGQNVQNTLLSESAQLALLDRYAGTTQAAMEFAQLALKARSLGEAAEQINRATNTDADDLMDLIEDVAAANIIQGEEVKLRAELRQLENSRATIEACQRAHSAFSAGVVTSHGSSGSVYSTLKAITRELQGLQAEQQGPPPDDDNDELAEEEELLEEDDGAKLINDALDLVMQAETLLMEAESRVETFAMGTQFSDRRYDVVSKRLKDLDKLKYRYRQPSFDALLLAAEEAQSTLDDLENLQQRKESIVHERRQLARQMGEAAVELSRRRREAVSGLKQAVESSLAQLGMEGSQFHVKINWTEADPSAYRVMGLGLDGGENGDVPLWGSGSNSFRVGEAEQLGEEPDALYKYTSNGLDSVTFLLAASPAEPLRPLAHVASGGESARIMLALKTTPGASGTAGSPVAVFDELDSGVGGRLGSRVGDALRRLSEFGNTQVLCVTHLPQVAVFADKHLKVVKHKTDDGRAITAIQNLTSEHERVQEISQMLGMGTDAAAELITNAAQLWRSRMERLQPNGHGNGNGHDGILLQSVKGLDRMNNLAEQMQLNRDVRSDNNGNHWVDLDDMMAKSNHFAHIN
eukprot:jgi/Chlat1/7700/Chrsp64S07147